MVNVHEVDTINYVDCFLQRVLTKFPAKMQNSSYQSNVTVKLIMLLSKYHVLKLQISTSSLPEMTNIPMSSTLAGRKNEEKENSTVQCAT